MAQLQLDVQAFRMLLADWFAHLARKAGLPIDQYGNSDNTFTFGSSNAFNITAQFIQDSPFLRFISSDISQQELVNSIAQQAFTHVNANDFGSIVWYSTSLPASGFQLSPPYSMGPFLEQLGIQTRIIGWRRLGSNILIEFTEELPPDWYEKNALFAPKSIAHAHIAIPAPCVGNFSSHVAHQIIEIVAAICSFALGRGVALPPSIFPSKTEEFNDLNKRRIDSTILTLARKHISLDIFTQIAVPGGLDHFARMRAALLTYDAAIQQQRDSIACILYVVAAEALTTPNTAWRDSKLTKRFIEFYNELIPSTLDKIITHSNFEMVFGIRCGTRTPRALRHELLNQIYDYRSGHVHAGLQPSYHGFGSSIGISDNIRRGLFADFVEGAILGYLESPRCSLIGHPSYS